MPIPALDIIVLGVTLISAVLATVRGATREILAIVAWIIAGFAAYFLHPAVTPYVAKHISNETIALIVAIAGVFLITLLVVSIITVKVSDMILDSRIGALDRTLGFLFGVVRGLLLCVIGWVMLSWFLQGQNPDWIKEARTRPMLESSGEVLQSAVTAVVPEKALSFLKTLKAPSGEGTVEPEDAPAEGETPSGDQPAQSDQAQPQPDQPSQSGTPAQRPRR